MEGVRVCGNYWNIAVNWTLLYTAFALRKHTSFLITKLEENVIVLKEIEQGLELRVFFLSSH